MSQGLLAAARTFNLQRVRCPECLTVRPPALYKMYSFASLSNMPMHEGALNIVSLHTRWMAALEPAPLYRAS